MNTRLYAIKPLEWSEEGRHFHTSEVLDGAYSISFLVREWNWAFARSNDGEIGDLHPCTSLDHAKSLAQADWESRILPALEEVDEDFTRSWNKVTTANMRLEQSNMAMKAFLKGIKLECENAPLPSPWDGCDCSNCRRAREIEWLLVGVGEQPSNREE